MTREELLSLAQGEFQRNQGIEAQGSIATPVEQEVPVDPLGEMIGASTTSPEQPQPVPQDQSQTVEGNGDPLGEHIASTPDPITTSEIASTDINSIAKKFKDKEILTKEDMEGLTFEQMIALADMSSPLNQSAKQQLSDALRGSTTGNVVDSITKLLFAPTELISGRNDLEDAAESAYQDYITRNPDKDENLLQRFGRAFVTGSPVNNLVNDQSQTSNAYSRQLQDNIANQAMGGFGDDALGLVSDSAERSNRSSAQSLVDNDIPFDYFLSGMIGSAVPGTAIGKAVGLGRSGLTTAQMAGRAAGAGAIEGAISGAGNADGNGIGGRLVGGATGGALGGAIGGGSVYAANLARGFWRGLSNQFGSGEAKYIKKSVEEMAKQAGIPVRELDELIANDPKALESFLLNLKDANGKPRYNSTEIALIWDKMAMENVNVYDELARTSTNSMREMVGPLGPIDMDNASASGAAGGGQLGARVSDIGENAVEPAWRGSFTEQKGNSIVKTQMRSRHKNTFYKYYRGATSDMIEGDGVFMKTHGYEVGQKPKIWIDPDSGKTYLVKVDKNTGKPFARDPKTKAYKLSGKGVQVVDINKSKVIREAGGQRFNATARRMEETVSSGARPNPDGSMRDNVTVFEVEKPALDSLRNQTNAKQNRKLVAANKAYVDSKNQLESATKGARGQFDDVEFAINKGAYKDSNPETLRFLGRKAESLKKTGKWINVPAEADRGIDNVEMAESLAVFVASKGTSAIANRGVIKDLFAKYIAKNVAGVKTVKSETLKKMVRTVLGMGDPQFDKFVQDILKRKITNEETFRKAVLAAVPAAGSGSASVNRTEYEDAYMALGAQ